MNVASFKRYIPLAVWIAIVFTIILIPLKIISYGFLPMDDALRHAAKTISGKIVAANSRHARRFPHRSQPRLAKNPGMGSRRGTEGTPNRSWFFPSWP